MLRFCDICRLISNVQEGRPYVAAAVWSCQHDVTTYGYSEPRQMIEAGTVHVSYEFYSHQNLIYSTTYEKTIDNVVVKFFKKVEIKTLALRSRLSTPISWHL